MNYYNLYYEGLKINSQLVSDNDLKEILTHEKIYKKNKYTDELKPIITKNMRIVPCIKI